MCILITRIIYQQKHLFELSHYLQIQRFFLWIYGYLCFSSSSLLQWAAFKFEDATFVTYEQVHPEDGFGIVMQKHFESMNSPLLSLTKFPDLESQEHRYVSRVCLHWATSVQDITSVVPWKKKKKRNCYRLVQRCTYYLKC
jgi:hypothetical protein